MRIPRKPALTIAALAVMMTAPNHIPAFKDYKVLDWSTVPHVLDFNPRPARSADPVADEQLRLRPNTSPERAELKPLLDPSGALIPFYDALYATETKEPGAVTRILHYGDSPTTADLITADVRKLFQDDFGDAGHGFALLAKPWAWYQHRGLEIRGSGWQIDPAPIATIKDGFHGLGAVSFRGGPGASARVTLRDPSHTDVELAFLSQPGGGTFQVLADGEPIGQVDTESPVVTPNFQSFPLPNGAKEISVANVTGRVRLYGYRFYKDTPGVEYNSLGVNGAYISLLARMIDEEHWIAQLRHYKPHLVIINYGTNESVYEKFVDTALERELLRVIARIRKASPTVAILIMSPMDRGQRMTSGEIGTVPALNRLVTIEQRVAAEQNCAFFNTFEAMGGPGTMGRWYMAEPRMVGADLIHPMPAGARIVGNLFYRSLQAGYQGHKLTIARKKFATIKGPPDSADPN